MFLRQNNSKESFYSKRNFKYTVLKEGDDIARLTDYKVLKISGELDHHSAGAIKEKLCKMTRGSGVKNIVLDLKELRFMDSSGIGVLLGRYKELKAKGGRIYVANVSKNVDKLLKISGVYQVISKL